MTDDATHHIEFQCFLPQMRMSFDVLTERAHAAEAAGFTGMALMDHLAPPLALDKPMYDAIVTATWLAAQTETLTLSHLVLCDAFRHPAVLAKQAVSIDHATNGRFELGIGWGSVPEEFDTFGVGDTAPATRVSRLEETLEVINALWRGDSFDYDGEYHHMQAAQQAPLPLDRIPIVIGGAGRRTLDLVAKYADWWNIPMHSLDRLDEMRAHAGKARVSVQQRCALVTDPAARDEVTAKAKRNFGSVGLVVGEANELVDYYGSLRDRGVERVYVWFADFAPPATLAAFGEGVIAALS